MNHTLLGPPVGPRSHFLPITPIVTIGQQLPIKGNVRPYEAYVMHHEYIHYEQHLTWPITLLKYVYQSIKLTEIFAKLHKVCIRKHEFIDALFRVSNLVSYESRNWDDSKVAAKQSNNYEIGLVALLEGGAILDCLLKPPKSDIAQVGIAIIESLFKTRDLTLNRPHIIGTESCLAAVGLGNQEFRDTSKQHLFNLAASLPNLVMLRTMGKVIHSQGLPKTQWNYSHVYHIVTKNISNLLTDYCLHLKSGLRMLFSEKCPDIWMKNYAYYRDEYIVGMYTMLNFFHNSMRRVLPNDAPAYPLLAPLWIILNLLNIYEAMNSITLTKYGAPYTRPEFIPVPALFFDRRTLSSLWIEIKDITKREIVVHWTGSDLNSKQLIGWITWCSYAVLHSLARAIEQHHNEVICPFRSWVQNRYNEVNIYNDEIVSDHLATMCNMSLRLTTHGQYIETQVNPSVNYCKCSTMSAPETVKCLFRSVVKEVMYPTVTIQEAEKSVKEKLI